MRTSLRALTRNTLAAALLIALVPLTSACSETSSRAPKSPPQGKDGDTGSPDKIATPAKTPAWELDKVGNLARLGKLSDRQRELLAANGFFLAPQPMPAKPAAAGERVPLKRATHLFHVYERNDYITFPSFVTADLAIDTTHAYFDAVMREVEEKHLVPKLQAALEALLKEAEQVRVVAKTKAGREQAARAVAFWGVALHLLISPALGDFPESVMPELAYEVDEEDRPAPPKPRKPLPPNEVPKTARRDVDKVTRAVQGATGSLPVPIVRAELDLTQMKPRGHYNRNGVLQRYFRSMSWLGMARFEIGGNDDDVEGIALLARSWLGSKAGREGMKRVLDVTSFFAGGPDAADMAAAAARLEKAVPGAASMSADDLVAPANLDALRKGLADLPAPRVQTRGPAPATTQVRVMGRRAFEDTVAMKNLVGPLIALVEKSRDERAIAPMMGALGAAAMLGSDIARDHLASLGDAEHGKQLAASIDKGRASLNALPPVRWTTDAYHGTLGAVRHLLAPVPATAPQLLRTEAWSLRALQAFAAGWAELRHDTILYGEQLGAECDAPEPEPPHGWVEPLPEVYAGLAAMVRELNRRLGSAGIPGTVKPPEDNMFYRPLSEKAEMVIEMLELLEEISRKELAGEPLDRNTRQKITLIGGRVEWLLISLADTDLLSPRDQDMAVVADVFTWRPSGKVVEVGVGHPELIYALVPGPSGPVVARGAVMSYREFLQPQQNRLTDEAWRKQLGAGKEPARPDWVRSIYAEAVPAIALRGEGVGRCGPMSGARIDL